MQNLSFSLICVRRRQCFFNNERYLRFFKLYTQANCELECLTNHTLKECSCVKFSMPSKCFSLSIDYKLKRTLILCVTWLFQLKYTCLPSRYHIYYMKFVLNWKTVHLINLCRKQGYTGMRSSQLRMCEQGRRYTFDE